MSEEIKEFAPVAQENPKFDVTKKYTWSKDDSFVLTGGEFGLILNALRSVVGTQEAQAVFLANEAVEVIESVLGSAVEKGQVKEIA
jgi:hypothetical protein